MSDDERGTIEIEEERVKEPYTMVPNSILTDAHLSMGAKLTYAMLLKYAWYEACCFPGQVRLARDLGAGERSVRRYLDELRQSGLLRVKRQGLGKTNLYTLLRWIERSPAKMAGTDGPATANAERPDRPAKKTQTEKTKKKGNGAPSVAPSLSPNLDLNRVPLEQQKALRTSGTYGKMVQY